MYNQYKLAYTDIGDDLVEKVYFGKFNKMEKQ